MPQDIGYKLPNICLQRVKKNILYLAILLQQLRAWFFMQLSCAKINLLLAVLPGRRDHASYCVDNIVFQYISLQNQKSPEE